MSFLWIVLLGALHGMQPDHAAAAAALAARTGTSAWAAALRIALGHAAALALVALAITVVPRLAGLDVERWLDAAAGVSLLVLAGALLFQVLRARYLMHAHAHDHGGREHEHAHVHPVRAAEAHEHGHVAGAVGVGLVLGLAGARSLAAMLPGMSQRAGPVLALALYCAGIAMGASGVSLVVDVARTRLARWLPVRFLDVVTAACALASATWILSGAR